jgi:hypothetical protein
MNKEHLQAWYRKWLEEHKETDLLYVNRGRDGAYLEQVHFVRDIVSRLVLQGIPYDKLPTFEIEFPEEKQSVQYRLSAYVVGEHTSKSVRLPVFMLEREDLGVRFIMRDNFHDWNVSIETSKDVPAEVLEGFGLDTTYCFFQGFPAEYCFSSYNENKRQFSICVRSSYDLYTLIWLIMRWVIKD